MSEVGLNNQSWSIIIFCYNEQGSILKVIEDSLSVIKELSPDQNEVIVVDDGSNDGSVEKIKKAESENENLITVFHSKNRGIGQALLSGYNTAKYENLSAIPGDGQFDVSELVQYKSLSAHTMIAFWRKVNTSYSLFRNILSLFNKKFNQIFLGFHLHDVNWVKIYKRDDLKSLDLELKSSLIETEICAKLKLKGVEIIEVESSYRERIYDDDKGASFKIIWQAAKEMFKLIRVIRKVPKVS